MPEKKSYLQTFNSPLVLLDPMSVTAGVKDVDEGVTGLVESWCCIIPISVMDIIATVSRSPMEWSLANWEMPPDVLTKRGVGYAKTVTPLTVLAIKWGWCKDFEKWDADPSPAPDIMKLQCALEFLRSDGCLRGLPQLLMDFLENPLLTSLDDNSTLVESAYSILGLVCVVYEFAIWAEIGGEQFEIEPPYW